MDVKTSRVLIQYATHACTLVSTKLYTLHYICIHIIAFKPLSYYTMHQEAT